MGFDFKNYLQGSRRFTTTTKVLNINKSDKQKAVSIKDYLLFEELSIHAPNALKLALDQVLKSANLGLKDEAKSWDDTSDEVRAMLGINTEIALINLLKAKKNPDKAIDIKWKDYTFDVKLRSNEIKKDIKLSEEQSVNNVLVIFYNIKENTYSVYFGVPPKDKLCSISKGGFSLAAGNIEKELTFVCSGNIGRPANKKFKVNLNFKKTKTEILHSSLEEWATKVKSRSIGLDNYGKKHRLTKRLRKSNQLFELKNNYGEDLATMIANYMILNTKDSSDKKDIQIAAEANLLPIVSKSNTTLF